MGVPEPIPITVIHKSLRRKEIWGECDEATRTIWVERKHPNSQALLGTLIHEAIHLIAADAGNPDWPEEKVVLWEKAVAQMLWEQGYRRIQP